MLVLLLLLLHRCHVQQLRLARPVGRGLARVGALRRLLHGFELDAHLQCLILQHLLLSCQCIELLLLLLHVGHVRHGGELLLQLRQLRHRQLRQLRQAQVLRCAAEQAATAAVTAVKRHRVAARMEASDVRRAGKHLLLLLELLLLLLLAGLLRRSESGWCL